jgi:peptidoglycan/LPS O-acetylase OafA/YrhL
VGTLTPAYFDFLGLGGLLAVVWKNQRAQLLLRLAGIVAVVLLAVSLTFGFTTSHDMILWALAFTALVSKGAEGFSGPVGALMSWSVLRYIGRISYGIYLYHLPVLLLLTRGFKKLGSQFPDAGLEQLIMGGTITVLIAALSWHFFEAPINRLKRFFPYRARAPQFGHICASVAPQTESG